MISWALLALIVQINMQKNFTACCECQGTSEVAGFRCNTARTGCQTSSCEKASGTTTNDLYQAQLCLTFHRSSSHAASLVSDSVLRCRDACQWAFKIASRASSAESSACASVSTSDVCVARITSAGRAEWPSTSQYLARKTMQRHAGRTDQLRDPTALRSVPARTTAHRRSCAGRSLGYGRSHGGAALRSQLLEPASGETRLVKGQEDRDPRGVAQVHTSDVDPSTTGNRNILYLNRNGRNFENYHPRTTSIHKVVKMKTQHCHPNSFSTWSSAVA